MGISQGFIPGKVLHPECDDLDWNLVSNSLVFYRDRNVVLLEQKEPFSLPLVLSCSGVQDACQPPLIFFGLILFKQHMHLCSVTLA